MAEQMSTPRITASYLDSFVGRVVLLVGKVTQLLGDQATLDSDGTVTVLLDRVSSDKMTRASPVLASLSSCNPLTQHVISGCTSFKRERSPSNWQGQPGPVDQGSKLERSRAWCW